MKFIKVKDGTAIAIDKIKMIRKSGELSCKIHTSSDVYEVDVPFDALLGILETDDKNTLQKILNIMKQQGNFAG